MKGLDNIYICIYDRLYKILAICTVFVHFVLSVCQEELVMRIILDTDKREITVLGTIKTN